MLHRSFRPLVIATVIMFAVAPFLIARAPYEATMGLVQKIFYFHVPAAMMMFLSAFVCGIASARFLFQKRAVSDRTAFAAAELVVIFGAIVLVTGPLWARKAWGVWWQWDARLTMALLLELVFVAYLLVRAYGGPGSDKLAAAVGLFGLAVSPFVYVSVNIWRTIHPLNTVVPTLQPGMRGPFWFCALAFLLLFALLLNLRVHLATEQGRLDELYLAEEDSAA